jgi:hypothetical protein
MTLGESSIQSQSDGFDGACANAGAATKVAKSASMSAAPVVIKTRSNAHMVASSLASVSS